MMFKVICLLVFAVHLVYAEVLSCYSCAGITNIASCDTITKCKDGQSCFARSTRNGQQNVSYTMGCTDNRNCGHIPDNGDKVDKLSVKQPYEQCYECCGKDECNNALCSRKIPPPCIDNDANCPFWNEAFDICNITYRAKFVCRKFCDLCLLVDGNWADWSQWSGCDVTCNQGEHTRTRTCSNPPPAFKGLDCEGSSIETKPCTRPLCPVHGGWTDWTEWGACPVTCGTGIQKRHRSCSSPYPLRHGDHCFGDTLDVKICEHKSCNSHPRGRTGIAFHSYHVTNRRQANTHAVVFSEVLINQGSPYNKTTGVFTAPRNGTYVFFAHLCSKSRSRAKFEIIVDGQIYATAFGFDWKISSCDAVQAVTQLQVNSTVYIKCAAMNSPYNLCQEHYCKNIFSGYLIDVQ